MHLLHGRKNALNLRSLGIQLPRRAPPHLGAKGFDLLDPLAALGWGVALGSKHLAALLMIAVGIETHLPEHYPDLHHLVYDIDHRRLCGAAAIRPWLLTYAKIQC